MRKSNAPVKYLWNSTIRAPTPEEIAERRKVSRSQARPIKAKNPKRAKANNARAYGSHAKWIRSLACCVCKHAGHTVAAHTKTGGTSRKSDAKWLVPMCCNHWIPDPEMGAWWDVEGCHEESHRGIKTFEAKHGVDLKAIAAQLWRESPVRGGESADEVKP